MKEEKWFCDGCKKEMTDEMNIFIPAVGLEIPRLIEAPPGFLQIQDNEEARSWELCETCTARIRQEFERIQEEQPENDNRQPETGIFPAGDCSFCGKKQPLDNLIPSPELKSGESGSIVYICKPCINRIINDPDYIPF